MKMTGPGTTGDVFANLVIESDEPHRILLTDQHICQRGGHFTGVIEFVMAFGAFVVHRATGIDDDGGAKIGLFVKFANVKAIRTAEDLPVESFDLIALDVWSVLAELNGKAFVWGCVEASVGAFHDAAREEGKPIQLGQVFGAE